MKYSRTLYQFSLILFCSVLLFSCSKFKPTDAKNNPTNALERARKNVEEGRGVSIGGLFKNKNTNYEFSTSNPMWRASLEILDFLPLNVVDYSGGIIITDWYNDDQNNDSIKITVRFLSNEIRSDSLKISVHQKKCSANLNCKINSIQSRVQEELITSIIKKAAILENELKKK